jgi:hypothetical protein
MSAEEGIVLRSPGDVSERIVVKGIVDPDKAIRAVVKGAADAAVILKSSHSVAVEALQGIRQQDAEIKGIRAGLDVASLYAKVARLDIPQTLGERALQYVAAMDASKFSDIQTTSERILRDIGTNSAVNAVAEARRISESVMDHAGVANALDIINKADITNKAVLGVMSAEAKLGGFAGDNFRTVSDLAEAMNKTTAGMLATEAKLQPAIYQNVIAETAALIGSSSMRFWESELARIREIQALPRDIIAAFSPTSHGLLAELTRTAQAFDSPIARRLKSEEEEWAGFVKGLEREHGIDGRVLRRLLPSPLPALNSVKRLTVAQERVRALSRLCKLGPTNDDPTGRDAKKAAKWLSEARREEAAALRAAKAAHLLPGIKGQRLAAPRWAGTWAQAVKKDGRWSNPTMWPWLGDRAHDLATYLSGFVLARRARGGRGADSLRGRKMTNEVAELTADLLNRWYRRQLFYRLNFTAAQVKSAVSYRERIGRKPVKYRSNVRRKH